MACDNTTWLNRRYIPVNADTLALCARVRAAGAALRRRHYADYHRKGCPIDDSARFDAMFHLSHALEDHWFKARRPAPVIDAAPFITDGQLVQLDRAWADIPAGRYTLRHESGDAWTLERMDVASGPATNRDELAAMARQNSLRPLDSAAITREAQLLALRAAAPMRPRGTTHSADVIGLPLFEPCLL